MAWDRQRNRSCADSERRTLRRICVIDGHGRRSGDAGVGLAGDPEPVRRLLITGALVVPVGIVLLGAAMLHSLRFGSTYGWFSIVLGVVGVFGSAVGLFDPASAFVAASILGMAVFDLVVGWRTFRSVGSTRYR
jgi:hypothetical protein